MFIFPQRVDETLDVAGEDSSQAEDAVPGDTAEEGKPPSKTQTLLYPFLLSLYHLYCIMLLNSYGLGLY